MKDYYTLIEILITLYKNNKNIRNQLSYLSAILKIKKGINSFDYDFDYYVDNGIYLKYIRHETTSFDNIIFSLKRQNESLVVKNEDGNYNLENQNIATINPTYQKHFNEIIGNIVNNEFLNKYFLEISIVYNDYTYYLIINPNGLCITRKRMGDVDTELVFDAKNVDVKIKNINGDIGTLPSLSIFKLKVPKYFFTDAMIDITDRTLESLGDQDLTNFFVSEIVSSDNCEISSYLLNRQITKKMY